MGKVREFCRVCQPPPASRCMLVFDGGRLTADAGILKKSTKFLLNPCILLLSTSRVHRRSTNS